MHLCTYNKTEPHDVSPEVCTWHAERRDANCADCDTYKNLVSTETHNAQMERFQRPADSGH